MERGDYTHKALEARGTGLLQSLSPQILREDDFTAERMDLQSSSEPATLCLEYSYSCPTW